MWRWREVVEMFQHQLGELRGTKDDVELAQLAGVNIFLTLGASTQNPIRIQSRVIVSGGTSLSSRADHAKPTRIKGLSIFLVVPRIGDGVGILADDDSGAIHASWIVLHDSFLCSFNFRQHLIHMESG